jgi:hypothetical protein
MLNTRTQGIDHGLRRNEVHISNPQGQYIIVIPVPLEAVGVMAIDRSIEVVNHAGRSSGDMFISVIHLASVVNNSENMTPVT